MRLNINWFLGVLAIELWIAPYLIVFWPEIRAAWRRRRRNAGPYKPATLGTMNVLT